jgi:hypothetical protein
LSPAGNTGIVANALAFSRRGDLLAAAIGTEVVVWKIENPDAAPFRTFQGASRFLAFTSEDTRLVGVRVDAAEARMWDLRDPISPPISFKSGSSANIRSIAVPRDGDDYLALGDEEGNTWVWPLWEAAANRLCARVTRNLSMKEWQSVMPQSIPYKATCPALPAGTDAR